MPSREDRDSLETLRAAAREQVEETGLRAVARDVGISHPALADFLSGTTPRKSSVAKLRKWYEGEGGELVRLRQEVAELRKRLAECEKRQRGAG